MPNSSNSDFVGEARELAKFIRERWNPANTMAPTGIAETLDRLAQQLEQERELRAAAREQLRETLAGQFGPEAKQAAESLVAQELEARQVGLSRLSQERRLGVVGVHGYALLPGRPVVTPVEERIDQQASDDAEIAEIRRIIDAPDFDPTEWPTVLTRRLLNRIDALLTEHSAREEERERMTTVLLEEGLLLPTERASEEWFEKYRAALLATESAQPEEERHG